MRSLVKSFYLATALALAAGAAQAGVKVSEKTEGYAIRGRSGVALLDQMDRRGPKHGFLARAIAQTKYEIYWKIDWRQTAKACSVKRADGLLDITYIFPRPSGPLSPPVEARWTRFLTGVRRHEKVHGDVAKQMARAAEKSILSVRFADDRGCNRARREVKRRLAEVYADYEAKQLRFDAREHGSGGTVERLVLDLVSPR